ncbi:multidrug ABC transporter ATP-binding protein [Mycobacterium sp. ACS1612]|uniref:ABC transporter ATP-binding protein/permease n=1 Tax=Mycobacterium sp. ACS1612 TaxID=1834117 RepID=UPI000800C35C|nr:ABC transporter ATP-binding protein/permease [Mycobacterium sp. ACS1612]OBF35864.1 multidrug ABC transporter ATP-binding protein [Mycobacterium sp. ACS1612]
MNTFQPSIDWSREFVNSTLWVLQVWAITACALLVVLIAIGRSTEWGRQFWRISGDYFKGRQSAPVWAMLGLLLASAILVVRINVLLSYYANDLFSALQLTFQPGTGRSTGIHGFWMTILVFAVLAVCYVARTLGDLYLTQTFIMRWRIWLSRQFIDDWLGDYAYFRGQFTRQPIDNPDQRIQQDIDIFTAGVGGEPNNPANTSDHLLLFGAVEAVVSVFSFGAILWRLSGPLTLGTVTLPRALFWVVIGYVLVATVVAFVIGRPLIRLSFMNELLNAGFRYALVRLRDASAAIGSYRGEKAERSVLTGRLSAVMTNYGHWRNRMVVFTGWNLSMSQAIDPLPFIVQAPRLFAGRISLGDIFQSATAFHTIHNSLSFFRDAYDSFASYRAAVIRLDGLADENAVARRFAKVTTATSADGSLEVTGVAVRTPGGDPLIRPLDLTLQPGDALLISGPSGIGKTVLLQSLAGLWPFVSGSVRLPADRDRVLFVPQLPYIPLGDLRAVVSYPLESGAVPDHEVQQALVKVALSHLAIRLNEVRDWAKVLSVGEQQRIAFARLLLAKPRAVFLDESTSAMDEGLELMLYDLIRTEFPDAILVSVSHRSTVERFHGRHLELVDDGEWRLDALPSRS